MSGKSCCIAITLIITQSWSAFSQDIHDRGRELLIAKSNKKFLFQKDFHFAKISRTGSQIILESFDPPCFVIFQKVKKDTIVVGYSTTNLFTRDDSIQEVARSFLKAMEKASPDRMVKSGLPGATQPVDALLQTRWNQDEWYNRYCPFNIDCKAGENCYAGCIAVAMGQIIRYFGKWNDILIDAEYNFHNEILHAYSTGYDWSSMIDIPCNYDLEVSRLLADLGILVKMKYGPYTSTQGSGMARIGFNLLGYENAYRANKHYYSNKEWNEMFYESLAKYSPVFVAGGGHAFVCDGYDSDGRLHFNLGWGGYADGYYDQTCIHGNLCANEAVFELIPNNNFEAPSNIRVDYSSLDPQIIWSAPGEWGNPDAYRIYYSDDDYFESTDTTLFLHDLKPGTNNIMVSALYPDGESLWIGPVGVYNPGERVFITDQAISNAIHEPDTTDQILLGSNTAYEGVIADIHTIKIDEPLMSADLIGEMVNLQELSLNASGLGESCFESFYNLSQLQKLEIRNYEYKIPELNQFGKLVHLSLDSCKLEDLSFLNGMDQLVVLELRNCEIENFDFPDHTSSLEQLVIENIKFSHAGFIEEFTNIRRLEISSCGIDDINFEESFPRLTCLNLSGNNLTNTLFLEKFPMLKTVCLNNNKIETLSLHADFEYLTSIDLSNNKLNKSSIAFDIPSLLVLNLSNNSFVKFPGIFKYMPNLAELNISNNAIDKLPKFRLPYLRKLEISNNRLNHISTIDLYEALKHLNLSGNPLSDLSPLLSNDNYRNLIDLDLRGLPLSKESYLDVIPELKKGVHNLYFPENYEGRSPCYVIPESPARLSNRELEFSWYCENPDNNVLYDLYFGSGDSIRLVESDLKESRARINLSEGQVYKWQVVAQHQDTSFYSGLYEVRTTEALEIPYMEDFELYANGASITKASSNWRLTHGNSETNTDALVSNERSHHGFGKSLHLTAFSNIALDLDHIDVITLIIEFDQFIIPGHSAHARFNNLHGLQIDTYSGDSGSVLFLNGAPHEEFSIIPDQWNHFRLSIQGFNKRIIMQINGSTVLNQIWEFNNSRAQIESIVFPSTHPTDYKSFSNIEYFIDNLHIYDANNRTFVEDKLKPEKSSIGIYPNPADRFITITGLPADQAKINLEIIDSRGQKIYQEILHSTFDDFILPVDHLAPGVYFVRLFDSNATLSSSKLLIAR